MPRALWKGAVSFGMVSIPVKLYTATDEKDISFNQLHKTDHERIRYQRYCPADDEVVELGDIVKGYQIAPDQYVIMEDEDFEKVPVDTTHTIEITDFVPAEQIDPIYYQKTYYLEPEKVGGKPFALLREVLKDSKLVALAKVTLRQKEQLATLRLYNNTIALETMFYADEIRATDEFDVPDVKVGERELQMAKSLVDMLTGDFEPDKYQDNYREALLELIEQKAQGQEISRPAAPAASKVTDLMEALRASVESARRERGEAAEEEEAAPKKRAKAAADDMEEAKPARRRKAG
jgi:DNA end-binding protein Ku